MSIQKSTSTKCYFVKEFMISGLEHLGPSHFLIFINIEAKLSELYSPSISNS